MNDLLREILSSAGEQGIGQQLGVSDEDATRGLEALLPVLTGAAQHKVRQDRGTESLADTIRALDLDQIFGGGSLDAQQAREQGNRLLAELLGSKDTSRHVAAKASAHTGLDSGLLKKLLPIAATFFAKYMANKQAGARAETHQTDDHQGGGLTDILGSMLDKDGDGNFLDDVMGGVLGGMFGGK